jgi:hypothetical protein
MSKRLLALIFFISLSWVPGAAAQADDQTRPQETKPSQAPPAKTEAVRTEQAPPRTAEAQGQLANVRLELTISDERGDGAPVTKTVTMVMADRGHGRIRTSGDIRTPQGYRPIQLNVDANPVFTRDGRVRVMFTLEYRPSVGEGTSEDTAQTNISETMNVILEDGKPLVVSQSADPYTDRRVKVELKATILK